MKIVTENNGDNNICKFLLQTRIKGNAVFFGNAEDAIANGLMKEFPISKKSALPSLLGNIT